MPILQLSDDVLCLVMKCLVTFEQLPDMIIKRVKVW